MPGNSVTNITMLDIYLRISCQDYTDRPSYVDIDFHLQEILDFIWEEQNTAAYSLSVGYRQMVG